MRGRAHDLRHRDLEAARELSGDSETNRAPELGAFDGGERQLDIAAPAIVGQLLLAHHSRLTQPADQDLIQEHLSARRAGAGCTAFGWAEVRTAWRWAITIGAFGAWSDVELRNGRTFA